MRGGIDLTQEKQSYLRFSLEESVWFQKGQEVEELYSISLEPNVNITEDDHYVYIRGTLDLVGEYKNDGENEEVEEGFNPFLPKAVQTIERLPNGTNEFVHRFPVDITIPSLRVSSIDDIEVTIQSFDYDMPERNSLKLQAELMIIGIYDESLAESDESAVLVDDRKELESTVLAEERVEAVEKVELEDEVVEIEISNGLKELNEQVKKAGVIDFSKEVEKVPEGKREDAIIDRIEEPIQNTPSAPPIPDFQSVFRQTDVKEEELFEPFTVEAKRVPENKLEKSEEIDLFSISKPPLLTPDDSPISQSELQTARTSSEEKEIEKVTKEVSIQQIVKKSVRPPVSNHTIEQSPEEQQMEQKTPKSKTSDPLSLSNLFNRKQEDDQVRVKVCIVQQGETIDELAERYSINVQTLLQSNDLEPNQDIHEGQVLYIPITRAFKK